MRQEVYRSSPSFDSTNDDHRRSQALLLSTMLRTAATGRHVVRRFNAARSLATHASSSVFPDEQPASPKMVSSTIPGPLSLKASSDIALFQDNRTHIFVAGTLPCPATPRQRCRLLMLASFSSLSLARALLDRLRCFQGQFPAGH